MTHRPKIGAHVSVAGGLEYGIANAEAIGAETIQVFGASPRQWAAKLPGESDLVNYHQALQKRTVDPIFLHGPYLVNLASPDPQIFKQSVRCLQIHLQIAEMMQAKGVIFHVGSGQPASPARLPDEQAGREVDKEKGIRQAAQAMIEILDAVPGTVCLIIENSASGKKIGAWPEEVGSLMERINSNRVKVCLDTAHSLEAGLIEKYTPEKIEEFLDSWDKTVGLDQIVALHVNDSKTAYQSNHDRHENIGKGLIGLEGFRNLAKEKRLWDKAWLLEVPGFANQGPDKENIDILKSFF